MKRLLSLLAAAALLLASGCAGISRNAAPAKRELFAMDTYMTLTCYGENAEQALDAAVDEIRRLDALLSTGSPDSEVSRLNREGGGAVSADTAALVAAALSVYEDTDGAFDITILPLMELWGFPAGELHVPTDGELADALAVTGSGRISLDGEILSMEDGTAVDLGRISLDGGILSMEDGTAVDLGGIAKGYASARLMEIFRSFGVEHAIVSLGGNVQCLGGKPDGSDWRCGIRDPGDPEHPTGAEDILGVLIVRDTAVITSGSYERKLTDESSGLTYHHILDPRTGYPAETGLASVTVVCPDGTLADALSTACFVMGPERAEAFWRERSGDFGMILVRTDGSVRVTEDLAESFSSSLPFGIIR